MKRRTPAESHVDPQSCLRPPIDGHTYELFRHFYGLRRFTKGKDRPYGAVVGVLQTVLQMIESGDRVKGSTSRGPTSASPPTT